MTDPTPPALPITPADAVGSPDAPATAGRARSRGPRLVACGLAVAAVVAVAASDPAHGGFFPKCAFHWLTGWHCPGCGGTRAAHALLHGRPDVALRHNALAVAAMPVLTLAFVRFAREAVTGRIAAARRPVGPFVRWGIVFLALAFFVLRNVPAEPFCRLAPPAPAPGVSTLDAR